MPQMAPMMWQMIYLSTMVFLIITVCKNFFMEMNYLIKTDKKSSKMSKTNMWKW